MEYLERVRSNECIDVQKTDLKDVEKLKIERTTEAKAFIHIDTTHTEYMHTYMNDTYIHTYIHTYIQLNSSTKIPDRAH